jgi:hypothetical protein
MQLTTTTQEEQMRTYHVLIRNTETGIQRREIMHGGSAAEIRERAETTIGPSDIIDEIRWAD